MARSWLCNKYCDTHEYEINERQKKKKGIQHIHAHIWSGLLSIGTLAALPEVRILWSLEQLDMKCCSFPVIFFFKKAGKKLDHGFIRLTYVTLITDPLHDVVFTIKLPEIIRHAMQRFLSKKVKGSLPLLYPPTSFKILFFGTIHFQ